MMVFIKDLRATQDVNVKYICYDNSRENETFERLCKQGGMGENFEHTAHGMPQKIMELNVSLKHCNYAESWELFFLRNSQEAEEGNTSTLVENNSMKQFRHLCPFENFLGRDRKAY